MLAAIAQHRPAITYLAYPNNPTATLWDEGAVQRIIDAVGAQGGIVVMDEAYQPFASRTWLDRMRAEPARNAHVLLMRTLSKFGLAGVRLGYLAGPAALVDEIEKVRPLQRERAQLRGGALRAGACAGVRRAGGRAARRAHRAGRRCAPCRASSACGTARPTWCSCACPTRRGPSTA